MVTRFRPSKTTTFSFVAALLALSLSPLLPTAAASHCGTGITVASVSPSGAVPNAPFITVEARFNDTPETCGIASFSMTIDGTAVAATAFQDGTQYVVTYSGSFTPGPHMVQARVDEVCCNNAGSTNDYSVATWTFYVCETGLVEFCIAPGPEVMLVTLENPQTYTGPSHSIAGYVNLYVFTLPGGIVVTIPCVVLVVDSVAVNPCEAAGGVYASTLFFLVKSANEPPGNPLASVAVCRATLKLLVLGIGVNSAPILTLC
ncbi:MAG TPA: hypothetical protein VHH36_08290 [Candidatus Thermoplasmatota archaeon]|nr:hypothetical protein [Candidatus Thermoplasmatota archaeon]